MKYYLWQVSSIPWRQNALTDNRPKLYNSRLFSMFQQVVFNFYMFMKRLSQTNIQNIAEKTRNNINICFKFVISLRFADIPQVVYLTKLDKVCPKVEEDAKHVFHSAAVRNAVDKEADVMGLPRKVLIWLFHHKLKSLFGNGKRVCTCHSLLTSFSELCWETILPFLKHPEY